MADTAQDIYVTGLRNAHAVENQAVELLSRQVERLENYPEMAARLNAHIEESKTQATRIEQILERHGSSESWLKDTGLSIMGNVAAIMHAPAQDEVIKNSLANYAFEHFEMASYRALMVMAEMAGDHEARPLLQQSLDEEIAMAEWAEQHLDPTVRRYVEREVSGQKSGV